MVEPKTVKEAVEKFEQELKQKIHVPPSTEKKVPQPSMVDSFKNELKRKINFAPASSQLDLGKPEIHSHLQEKVQGAYNRFVGNLTTSLSETEKQVKPLPQIIREAVEKTKNQIKLELWRTKNDGDK